MAKPAKRFDPTGLNRGAVGESELNQLEAVAIWSQ